MHSKLNELKNNKNLVALYTDDRNGENFSVGYICEIKDDKVLVLNVGIYGEYDGYSGMYIDSIFRVETKSRYLEKIKKLISFSITKKLLAVSQSDIFDALIEKTAKNNSIFAVSYSNSNEIKGYVIEAKESLVIVEIDEYGYEEGENIINKGVIDKIVVDDVECRALEKLYKINKESSC